MRTAWLIIVLCVATSCSRGVKDKSEAKLAGTADASPGGDGKTHDVTEKSPVWTDDSQTFTLLAEGPAVACDPEATPPSAARGDGDLVYQRASRTLLHRPRCGESVTLQLRADEVASLEEALKSVVRLSLSTKTPASACTAAPLAPANAFAVGNGIAEQAWPAAIGPCQSGQVLNGWEKAAGLMRQYWRMSL